MGTIEVKFGSKDRIKVETNQEHGSVEIFGCFDFHNTIQIYRKSFGPNPSLWPIPEKNDHVSLQIKELVLKLKNQWNYPYLAEELCHCRNVSTVVVDEAILAGAHSPEKVSAVTSASTACGTCRKDVVAILNYRLAE